MPRKKVQDSSDVVGNSQEEKVDLLTTDEDWPLTLGKLFNLCRRYGVIYKRHQSSCELFRNSFRFHFALTETFDGLEEKQWYQFKPIERLRDVRLKALAWVTAAIAELEEDNAVTTSLRHRYAIADFAQREALAFMEIHDFHLKYKKHCNEEDTNLRFFLGDDEAEEEEKENEPQVPLSTTHERRLAEKGAQWVQEAHKENERLKKNLDTIMNEEKLLMAEERAYEEEYSELLGKVSQIPHAIEVLNQLENKLSIDH